MKTVNAYNHPIKTHLHSGPAQIPLIDDKFWCVNPSCNAALPIQKYHTNKRLITLSHQPPRTSPDRSQDKSLLAAASHLFVDADCCFHCSWFIWHKMDLEIAPSRRFRLSWESIHSKQRERHCIPKPMVDLGLLI